jgi:hypothetical protein
LGVGVQLTEPYPNCDLHNIFIMILIYISFRIPHPLLIFLSFFVGLHKKTGRQKEVYKILFYKQLHNEGGGEPPSFPRVHYRSHTIDLLEVRPAGECSRAREMCDFGTAMRQRRSSRWTRKDSWGVAL